MIYYLDTSAAIKLVVEESESASLAKYLNTDIADDNTIVSSMLLFTELHCVISRRSVAAEQSVKQVLDALTLADVERVDMLRAATSRWGLRSADAIHLATALRLECDVLVAYDRELLDAGTAAGLTVSHPTAK